MQTIAVVNPRESAHESPEDYEILRQDSGLYSWRGVNVQHNYAGIESSGAGWQTPEAAQADALYCLCTLDGDDHQTAMATLTVWRFFSNEVLDRCDRENSDIDFSDLEAAPGEPETMPQTAGALRAELEQLAETGNVTPDDYLRCWRAWRGLKDGAPREYYPVIIDRLNALLSSVLPPAHGEAGEIGALARATIAAMNSTDLVLDELKNTYSH